MEYAKATEQLDHFNAGNAWINAAVDRICHSLPDDVIPSADEIRKLSYDDRRLLLEVTGLRAVVSPRGTDRVKVMFEFPLELLGAPYEYHGDPEVKEKFAEWLGDSEKMVTWFRKLTQTR